MSRLARYILGSILAAVLAFGVTWMLLRPAPDMDVDEMAWMQKEFQLNPAQVKAIENLQAEYHPVCLKHCEMIMQARQHLAAAAGSADAQAELTRLEAVCHAATQAHLERVAAVMSPEQGERFLKLVLPKLSGQRHAAPLGLK